jgi:hypothetical protein
MRIQEAQKHTDPEHLLMEGFGAVQIITDPDADPGGTKAYGSGTLPRTRKVLSRYEFRQTFFSVSIFST